MKSTMRLLVKQSGLSRDQMADAMNEIVRTSGKGLCKGSRYISVPTLEKWLADDERGQLPDLWGLHVLMLAANSDLAPLETWLSLFGCGVLSERDKKKVEFAELEIEKNLRDKRLLELKTELMEKER